jgi:hypothetical protein
MKKIGGLLIALAIFISAITFSYLFVFEKQINASNSNYMSLVDDVHSNKLLAEKLIPATTDARAQGFLSTIKMNSANQLIALGCSVDNQNDNFTLAKQVCDSKTSVSSTLGDVDSLQRELVTSLFKTTNDSLEILKKGNYINELKTNSVILMNTYVSLLNFSSAVNVPSPTNLDTFIPPLSSDNFTKAVNSIKKDDLLNVIKVQDEYQYSFESIFASLGIKSDDPRVSENASEKESVQSMVDAIGSEPRSQNYNFLNLKKDVATNGVDSELHLKNQIIAQDYINLISENQTEDTRLFLARNALLHVTETSAS